jgi:hypothetical protein
MAFDRTDPADLLALKTEVTTDPIGVGYDVNGATKDILAMLNDAELNPGNETTGAPLTARVLWEISADSPDDLTPHGQFSVGDQFVMQQLFEISSGPDDDLSWARARVLNLFPANDGIPQAINALLRGLSRAEVLFGTDTIISQQDWFAARDS